MKSDRFRALAKAEGPFVSVYLDDSHDTPDARTRLELQWRHLDEQLVRHGAGGTLVDRIHQAYGGAPPAVGRHGLGIVAADDAVLQRFRAELDRAAGLATEGITGVCAALREGAVETLVIGDLGDSTVLVGDSPPAVAPDATVLSELGSKSASTARADEALPLAAIAIDADLVSVGGAAALRDGIGAVLRYAPRTAAAT